VKGLGRRRIQFDAIHLRALCHLWPFSILRPVGIFLLLLLLRSSQIGAALLNAAHLPV